MSYPISVPQVRVKKGKPRPQNFSGDALRSALEPRIPDFPLYHYTTAAGLEGVVRNSELFATHWKFLNDASEGKHAFALINALLERLRAEYSSAMDGHEMLAIGDLLCRLHNVEIPFYVACLSEKGNDLNQWRAYGRATSFQLEFDGEKLFEERGRAYLVRCVYSAEEKREIVERIVQCFAGVWRDMSEPALALASTRHLFEEACAVLSAMFKNDAFEEEAEWRLVIISDLRHDERVRFRSTPKGIVPHVPIELPVTSSLVRNIVVGPGQLSEANVESANMFLHSCGSAAGAYLSGIPYRE